VSRCDAGHTGWLSAIARASCNSYTVRYEDHPGNHRADYFSSASLFGVPSWGNLRYSVELGMQV